MILESVKDCLEARQEWTREKADAVEVDYRNFLNAAVALSDANLSPTEDVDTFWHWHILDTRKYRKDCLNEFGVIVDHNPNPQAVSRYNEGDLDEFLLKSGISRSDVSKFIADAHYCDRSVSQVSNPPCTDQIDLTSKS